LVAHPTRCGSVEVDLIGTRPALSPSLIAAAFLLCAGAAPAAAQTIDATSYPFTSVPGAALEDMSSGTTQLIGPDLDNAVSTVVPTGFEFWFAGVRPTSFSVNSNGLLRLGATVVTGAPTNKIESVLTAPPTAHYW